MDLHCGSLGRLRVCGFRAKCLYLEARPHHTPGWHEQSPDEPKGSRGNAVAQRTTPQESRGPERSPVSTPHRDPKNRPSDDFYRGWECGSSLPTGRRKKRPGRERGGNL